MLIRVDDTVEIQTGDDRKVKGRVLSVNHQTGKIIVEGANRVYKHVRRSQKNPQGGRLSKEMPLQASNVLFVCTKCNASARLGARYNDEGAKERFCRKCGQTISQIAPPRPAYANK